MSLVLLFSIRVFLARENKRRDAEPPDHSFDDIHVVRINEDGKRTEVRVSKVRVHSHWKTYTYVDVILRTGVFGFDRSTKSGL
jgi:hypothetical protein